jgi:hypothetical protein
MAKFKSPKNKAATPAASGRGAIPCLVVVVFGILLIGLLFYLSMQSATP